MLDFELASRITIITNRALCGSEAALLARIADFAAAGVSEIVVREKDLDEATYAALFGKILRACKSGFCADTARAVGIFADEACAAKFGETHAFAGGLDASAAYSGEISLCGAVCETKFAAQSIGNARSSRSAQYTESSESIEGVENSQSVKEAENSQSAEGAQIAEGARRLPALFVHNFADFALRKGDRNLWLPLGVLRSFSAAHGAEFLRANFKKLVASCHSEAEAREALELGAGAICLSHIFATDCKAGLAPKGLNLIRAVREFFAGEIYALGGITSRNFASVLRAGADRIAVMSSAMAVRDASDFIRKFKK